MTEVVNKEGFTEKQYFQQYDASNFQRPSVTVDILLFTVSEEESANYRKLPEKMLKVLLIKRGEHPHLGQWALPGGFVGITEDLNDAAYRELRSETHVDGVYLEQLYTWGEPDRDPRTRVISCSYMALADSKSLKLEAGTDADDARWFSVRRKVVEQNTAMTEEGCIIHEKILIQLVSDDISLTATIKTVTNLEKSGQIKREIVNSGGIAFDHARILEYGIERLRNKLEYTDIVFNLMPEYFTLTELQQVYETILDKELLKANFRRKIASLVLETNHKTKDEGHRPAKLYRFNPNWRKHSEWEKD